MCGHRQRAVQPHAAVSHGPPGLDRFKRELEELISKRGKGAGFGEVRVCGNAPLPSLLGPRLADLLDTEQPLFAARFAADSRCANVTGVFSDLCLLSIFLRHGAELATADSAFVKEALASAGLAGADLQLAAPSAPLPAASAAAGGGIAISSAVGGALGAVALLLLIAVAVSVRRARLRARSERAASPPPGVQASGGAWSPGAIQALPRARSGRLP